MDKPIPEAWMTPGGDVSRSFYWCLERCLPGQQPRPLYAAQQQGQAVFADIDGAIAETESTPEGRQRMEQARKWALEALSQPMQQGGGEVVAWIGAGHLREQRVNASRAGYGMPLVASTARRGEDCIPLYTAPPSAPVGVDEWECRCGLRGPHSAFSSHADCPLRPVQTAIAQQPAAVDRAGKVPVSESALRYCIRELNGARRGDNAEGRAELVHHVLTAWLDLATQHQEPTT